MYAISGHSRVLGAIFALGVLAGCADTAASPPPQVEMSTAPTTAPQLAGAWYQVEFDSNKSDIDARGRMIVNTVAHVAANNAATRVTVIGKTDSVGSATANLALSQRRADHVRDALINAGIPAARIDTRWTGEVRQQVATSDGIDEQRNRVVDITVVQQPR